MAAGALDMKSSNFGQTILGVAVNKAVTEVAHGLEQKAASLPAAVPDPSVAPTAAAEPGLRPSSSAKKSDFAGEPTPRRPDSGHILSGFAAHCHPSL